MLHSTTRFAISLSWCKAGKLYLAFSFLAGFVIGFVCAGILVPNCLLLMRRVASAPVSIVGLLLVWLLPFLITALAVYIFPAWCILLIAFVKAFCFGFTLHLIYAAFPGAGWLVWFFVLSRDTIGTLLLYIIWMRNIPLKADTIRRDLLISTCIMTLVSLLDFCLVSPFWVILINN